MTVPQCCGTPMRDVSEQDDLAAGCHAYLCDRCKSEQSVPAPEIPLDDRPTSTLPGTPERQEVYADRVHRGVQVFHPLDYHPDRPPLASPSTLGGAADPQLWGIRRKKRRWEVRLTLRGQRVRVGAYVELETAIAARDEAARRLGHPGRRRRAA